MRVLLLVPILCALGVSSSLAAQSAAVSSDWQRVKQLRLRTRVHLSTDKGGRTCSVAEVTDESLTCASGNTGSTYSRAEIKSIKVTRYATSAVGGAAIGAGIGAIIGVAASSGSTDGFGRLEAGVNVGIGAVGQRLVG